MSKRWTEVTTGDERVFTLECDEDDLPAIKEALGKVSRLSPASDASMSTLRHGAYTRSSRFEIVQHEYAGGGSGGVCGYWEVLEIKNPPDDRHPLVVHWYNTRDGHAFAEIEDLDSAATVKSRFRDRDWADCPGLVRFVSCLWLDPWFLAVGNQELRGDYAIPCGLEDHPLYTLGRRFLVTEREYDGNVTRRVKTCLGAIRISPRPHDGDSARTTYLVHWSDGSFSEIKEGQISPAVPFTGEIAWIDKVRQSCLDLITNRARQVEVNLTDGTRFVGFLAQQPDNFFGTEPGEYEVVVHFDNGQTRSGRVLFTEENSSTYGHLARMVELKIKRPDGAGVLAIAIQAAESEDDDRGSDKLPHIYFVKEGRLMLED
ncbi:MAG TPA: hypothetical protein PK263_00765 [bacterium]|nr:hypothetical protein [bacterium]